MARDEYGNRIDRRKQRTTKAGARGSSEQLRGLTGRRGYRPIFTGRRRGGANPASEQPFPDPPATWLGTLPEWAIYWAHGVLGLREDQDFAYLFTYGDGFINAYGPAQFDFYEYDLGVAIEIQGLFWHYEFGGRTKVLQDQERKARIESVGITLIFIDEDDALRDPIYFLRQARAGVDRSRVTRGF